MKKLTKAAALNVRSSVKAGGLHVGNHNRRALNVRSSVKAGGLHVGNHNRRALALA